MSMKKPPPWDIYVDERKVRDDSWLGFLAIPNTPSFMHKLHRCRENPDGTTGRFDSREVHFHNMSRTLLPLAERWIYRTYQHKGVRFYAKPWGRGLDKEVVVLDFLRRFCRVKRLKPPYDVVVFLDFDSSHARTSIQNTIREGAQIARCYHIDSRRNDCIQCADLLLGATVRLESEPALALRFSELQAKRSAGERLRDSESKQYIAGYLASLRERDSRTVRVLGA